MKSQVIVISCCRVYIPPATLLIGSDVIKVVPRVNNLGLATCAIVYKGGLALNSTLLNKRRHTYIEQQKKLKTRYEKFIIKRVIKKVY
jgi:hypothetical protein